MKTHEYRPEVRRHTKHITRSQAYRELHARFKGALSRQGELTAEVEKMQSQDSTRIKELTKQVAEMSVLFGETMEKLAKLQVAFIEVAGERDQLLKETPENVQEAAQ